jgi:hypothetical protein
MYLPRSLDIVRFPFPPSICSTAFPQPSNPAPGRWQHKARKSCPVICRRINSTVADDMFPWWARTCRENRRSSGPSVSASAMAVRILGPPGWIAQPAMSAEIKFMPRQPRFAPRQKLPPNDFGHPRRKRHLETMIADIPGHRISALGEQATGKIAQLPRTVTVPGPRPTTAEAAPSAKSALATSLPDQRRRQSEGCTIRRSRPAPAHPGPPRPHRAPPPAR